MTRLLALLLLAAVCTAGEAPAVKAPNAKEWKPVADAVAAGTADAVDRVKAITAAYPAWPDGHRTLAGILAQRGAWRDSYQAARTALKLAPNDAAAGEIAVLAAAQAGNYAVATAAARALAKIDAKGRIAYQGAAAALAAGDATDAATLLAPALAAQPASAEFLVLDGRIAAAGGDHVRAERVLTQATGVRRDQADAWYLLGLERMELADRQPTDRGRWLAGAKEAFEKAVQLRPRDAEALTGFGKALLDLSAHVEATGAAGRTDLLLQARGVLIRALAEKPDLVPALLFLGEVHLRGEAWTDAATVLQKAVDLGATSQDTLLLLVKAYGNAGDTAKASAIGKSISADSTGERIVLGMNAYRSGDHLLAAELLARAAGDSTQDQAQVASLWRWVGHARRRAAERLALAASQAPDPARQGELRRQEAEARDQARDAYRSAGDLGDLDARRWLVAAESVRDAAAANAAAGTALGWNAFDPSSLLLWIGSYPEAATGGEGMGGWWRRHPIHVVVLAVLTVIPLALFVWARLRPAPAPSAAAATSRPSSAPAPAKPTPKPATRPVAKPPTTTRPGTRPVAKPPSVPPAPSRPGARPLPRTVAPRPPAKGEDPNATQPL